MSPQLSRIAERAARARFFESREITTLGRLMLGHARVCHLCPGCARAREAAAAINRGDPWP
jgi:hypothetical protein